ncbi:MAG: HipA domain-containing protein [Gammaproteobacteria bacterium]|nr:HipA domain-containing protein [Gammaproteobacteria bacterium]
MKTKVMIGNEHALDVYLGKQVIAKLTLHDDQLYWHYSPAWQQSGYAVSPHLPLQGVIPTLNVQRFLRNLLPEGGGLDVLLSSFHLSKYNTFGLIRALGLDMPGLLVMLAPTQPIPLEASFRPITDIELEQRLNDRDEFSLIVWDGKPRLSVAGVQDKINVVLNQNAQLGFGEGGFCSTHILKFERQKLSHLVLNEYITMQLAKKCGLNVANTQLMRYGKHPALLVERFDRQLISMTEVRRRHIIDGCQALNLPPDYKYERNFGSGRDVAHIRDGASLSNLFDFTHQCANPALTKQHLLDWVIFNLLIFNFDAHGKNISFFVGASGITLAPFYDLVNIKMYSDFDHEMAMGLGDEFDGNIVCAYQLADFADSCQLARSLLIKRLQHIIKKLQSALDSEISKIDGSEEERQYLEQYQHIVKDRCEHLRFQAGKIASVKL